MADKGNTVPRLPVLEEKSDEENDAQAGPPLAESQESQISQQSSTGLSQDFNFLFSSQQDDNIVHGLPIDSELSLSIGVVCTAERKTTHKKQKEQKQHALQKTFYAYQKGCDDATKHLIQEKIDEDIADFKLQNYTVNTYTFGLPFFVDATCNISRGYNGKPKMLKADTKKRKAAEAGKSDEDESDDEDKEYHPTTTEQPATTEVSEVRVLRAKRSKKPTE
jgi:hypothetical protein